MNDLTTIATEINAEHELADQCANEALVHAAKCGALLNQAKALCKPGEWLPWLEGTCNVVARQAQKYMKLAVGYPKLASNTNARSYLTSLNSALALLTAPDDVKEEVEAHLANGERYTEKELLAKIREAKAEAKHSEDYWYEQSKSAHLKADEAAKLVRIKQEENKQLRDTIALEAKKFAKAERTALEKELEDLAVENANLVAAQKKARWDFEDSTDKIAKEKYEKLSNLRQQDMDQMKGEIKRTRGELEDLYKTEEALRLKVGVFERHQKGVEEAKKALQDLRLVIWGVFDEANKECFELPGDLFDTWANVASALRNVANDLQRGLNDSVTILTVERLA